MPLKKKKRLPMHINNITRCQYSSLGLSRWPICRKPNAEALVWIPIFLPAYVSSRHCQFPTNGTNKINVTISLFFFFIKLYTTLGCGKGSIDTKSDIFHSTCSRLLNGEAAYLSELCMSLKSMYHHANVYDNPQPLGWECTAHQCWNAVKSQNQNKP